MKDGENAGTEMRGAAARDSRRGGGWDIAAWVLAVATLVWLVAASESGEDRPLFLGLWRSRTVLIGGAAMWLAAGLWLGRSPAARNRFIALTLGVLAGWLLLEGAGAVGLVSYPDLFGNRKSMLGAVAIPHLDRRGQAQQDLASQWDAPLEPIPFHYKTGPRGFRNHLSRAEADLYLLGDSVLVAGLLPYEQTVTRRLEDDLHCEALNLALIGLAPQEECELLYESGLPLKGRLVLQFIFEGNDLAGSRQYRWEQEYRRSWVGKFNDSLLLQLLNWAQVRTSPRKRPAGRNLGYVDGQPVLFLWTRSSFAGLEGESQHVFAAIRSVRDWVLGRGGAYGVVYVPAKIRVLGPRCRWPTDSSLQGHEPHLNPLRESMRRFASESGVPLLDLTEPLQASANQGRSPWFAFDTHPNATGHEVMAKTITQWSFVVDWQTGRSRQRTPETADGNTNGAAGRAGEATP